MGAKMKSSASHTTTTTGASTTKAATTTTTTSDTSKNLPSWKARFASARRRSGSDLDKYSESQGGDATLLPNTNTSFLSTQRNKTKKNWKGSLKNLLPTPKKDADGGSSNPQAPDSGKDDAGDVSFLSCSTTHRIWDVGVVGPGNGGLQRTLVLTCVFGSRSLSR